MFHDEYCNILRDQAMVGLRSVKNDLLNCWMLVCPRNNWAQFMVTMLDYLMEREKRRTNSDWGWPCVFFQKNKRYLWSFKKMLTLQMNTNWPLGVWSVCADLKTVCIHCHHFRQIDSLPWLAHARAGLNPVWRLLWARSHRCRLCRRRRHRCRQSHYALFRLSAAKSVKKGL